MIRHLVSDICGTNVYRAEDGHELYIAIRDDVEEGNQICVDFAGIKIVTGSFLGAAFGNFYKTLDSDQLNELVTVSNLPSAMKPTFKDIMRDMNSRFAYERSQYLRRQQS